MALQWVRGPITAVMGEASTNQVYFQMASMGPRSDNRGYDQPEGVAEDKPGASMGPRSDNRGYAGIGLLDAAFDAASMGPRSDNRGYAARIRSFSSTAVKLQWVRG